MDNNQEFEETCFFLASFHPAAFKGCGGIVFSQYCSCEEKQELKRTRFGLY